MTNSMILISKNELTNIYNNLLHIYNTQQTQELYDVLMAIYNLLNKNTESIFIGYGKHDKPIFAQL